MGSQDYIDPVALSVSNLIDSFRACTDLADIERRADEFRDLKLREAVPALLEKLAEGRVRGDDDTFDAVCQALTTMGVMRQLGNLTFRISPPSVLAPDIRAYVEERRQQWPQALFDHSWH